MNASGPEHPGQPPRPGPHPGVSAQPGPTAGPSLDLDALEREVASALDEAVPSECETTGPSGRARVEAGHVAALERAHALLADALDDVERG